MSDFSLRGRIRQVMEQAATADPKIIADEVLGSITKAEQAAALAACLPEYVRIVVVGEWRARPAGPKAGQGRSWKKQAADDYVRKWLAQGFDVFGDGRGWKTLAELNRDDLDRLAGIRRRQAAELTDAAVWFERVAGLLAEHSVAAVGKLPGPVLVALASGGEVPAVVRRAA